MTVGCCQQLLPAGTGRRRQRTAWTELRSQQAYNLRVQGWSSTLRFHKTASTTFIDSGSSAVARAGATTVALPSTSRAGGSSRSILELPNLQPFALSYSKPSSHLFISLLFSNLLYNIEDRFTNRFTKCSSYPGLACKDNLIWVALIKFTSEYEKTYLDYFWIKNIFLIRVFSRSKVNYGGGSFLFVVWLESFSGTRVWTIDHQAWVLWHDPHNCKT